VSYVTSLLFFISPTTLLNNSDATAKEALSHLCLILSPYIAGKWTDIFRIWSEFLATDLEVPGSIPGPTRFSEK
jgi:hypothetical protein